MKRRSFLTLLGLAPAVAMAKEKEPKIEEPEEEFPEYEDDEVEDETISSAPFMWACTMTCISEPDFPVRNRKERVGR